MRKTEVEYHTILYDVLNAFAGATRKALKSHILQFPSPDAVNNVHRLSLAALCSSEP